MGAAGNSISIDVECKKCRAHSIIKSEVAQAQSLDAKNSALVHDIITQIQKLRDTQQTEWQTSQQIRITDDVIVSLSEWLKTNIADASDLFGQTPDPS